MRKSRKRSYMIKIFEKYAALGITPEESDIFFVFEKINASTECDSERRELIAVYLTLLLLRATEDKEVLESFYGVYLSGGDASQRRIGKRVLRYSFETHRDERTVYRLIAYAQKLYGKVLSELFPDASERIEKSRLS